MSIYVWGGSRTNFQLVEGKKYLEQRKRDLYAYTFKPAKYAKDCIAVQTLSIDGGFKNVAACIADEVKARYSNREDSYIMRASQFKRFKALVRSSYARSRRILRESFKTDTKGEQNVAHKVTA